MSDSNEEATTTVMERLMQGQSAVISFRANPNGDAAERQSIREFIRLWKEGQETREIIHTLMAQNAGWSPSEDKLTVNKMYDILIEFKEVLLEDFAHDIVGEVKHQARQGNFDPHKDDALEKAGGEETFVQSQISGYMDRFGDKINRES